MTIRDHDPIAEDSRTGSTIFQHDPIVFKLSNYFHLKLSTLKYITFTIIGIALLWPWNCFLSASGYYSERFINSPKLIKIYSSTMMSISTLTSTIYNFYLSQNQTNVNYNFRIKFGFYLTFFIFTIMAFSCILSFFIHLNDILFFNILMTMVLISSMATCLAQNGTMAIVNVLGSIYANAVMVGQAIAGVLPSSALIISILIVGDKKKVKDEHVDKDFGLFIYYITASLISMVSIGLLFLTTHCKEKQTYQRLNEIMEEPEEEEEGANVNEDVHQQKEFVPFTQLWSKLKLIVLTIFFTFSITLIFPIFASTVTSNNTNSSSKFFKKNIFIPFIYFVWNIGDLMGRLLCGYPKLKFLIKNPKNQIIYSLARLIFIPLFLTCNIHPEDSKFKPIINSDLWYILLQFLFGISNGQLCTSAFMTVAKYCDTNDEKEAAGGFTSVFLSFGLAAGSLFSYLLVFAI
ncbi:unnamed protein product [Candida verbasci]|uniref:Nucleoside transporter FUN26 n=1 Tax=Candida verbasci TaxID=1227364 RepID=A0A9W4U1E8_9ASCO|nr:unnamed protein product [Candida verbasci]